MLTLKLQTGRKRMGWIFCHYSGKFDYANMLPWAIPEYELLPDHADVDFLVLVGWTTYLPFPSEFVDFPKLKFISNPEPTERHAILPNCYNFCTGRCPADGPSLRYCPWLQYWAPPMKAEHKTRRCSVIDSGKWPWRVQRIKQTAAVIGDVHAYGGITGNKMGEYHSDDDKNVYGNVKYQALVDHAFNIALESFQLEDYWTEKIGDPILCETVPIYRGAPNIYDYFIPESLILVEDAAKVNWADWGAEYARRRPYVLQQKQLILTRFNIFSYFDQLTNDLSKLDTLRPIKR